MNINELLLDEIHNFHTTFITSELHRIGVIPDDAYREFLCDICADYLLKQPDKEKTYAESMLTNEGD